MTLGKKQLITNSASLGRLSLQKDVFVIEQQNRHHSLFLFIFSPFHTVFPTKKEGRNNHFSLCISLVLHPKINVSFLFFSLIDPFFIRLPLLNYPSFPILLHLYNLSTSPLPLSPSPSSLNDLLSQDRIGSEFRTSFIHRSFILPILLDQLYLCLRPFKWWSELKIRTRRGKEG